MSMILIHLEGYYFIKYVTTFRTTEMTKSTFYLPTQWRK